MDLIHLFLSLCNQGVLLGRYSHIGNGYGDRRFCGVLVAHFLNVVQHLGGHFEAVVFDTAVNDLAELLGAALEGYFKVKELVGIASVNIAQILRNGLVEDKQTHSCVNYLGLGLSVALLEHAHLNRSVETDDSVLISHHSFVKVTEHLALAGLACAVQRQVEGAQHHVLRRNGNGASVHRLQKVVGRQHKEARLCLSLCGKGNVYRHLVAVEVSVERLTYQRMELYCASFHKYGFKGLNGQTVQGRSTVEQHGMLFDNILQCVPYLRACLFHFLLCILDVGSLLSLVQSFHNEGLEQLKSHFLRQTALIDFQTGAYHDNGTAGVVNTLTQQVLTEASLLTAKHFGKGFKGTVIGACHGLTAAAVVDKCVHSLLKHTLFVAHDDFGSAVINKSFQTVVAVNNSAVQIVQIAGCKASAVKLYHGADVRRNDGNNVKDHPLGLVAGLSERFHHFKALDNANLFLTGCAGQLVFQLCGQLFDVKLRKKLLDSLGTHTYAEIVLIALQVFSVLLFGKELILGKGSQTGVDNDICGEVQHLFKVTGGDVQQKSHS